MRGKKIIFDDKKINKSNFYKNKKPLEIDGIDIDHLLISKKEPYGKKKPYLNTLLDIMMMISLDHIKLPQMIGYVKHFDSNKTMSFKVIDKGLLKIYISRHGKELIIQ